MRVPLCGEFTAASAPPLPAPPPTAAAPTLGGADATSLRPPSRRVTVASIKTRPRESSENASVVFVPTGSEDAATTPRWCKRGSLKWRGPATTLNAGPLRGVTARNAARLQFALVVVGLSASCSPSLPSVLSITKESIDGDGPMRSSGVSGRAAAVARAAASPADGGAPASAPTIGATPSAARGRRRGEFARRTVRPSSSRF